MNKSSWVKVLISLLIAVVAVLKFIDTPKKDLNVVAEVDVPNDHALLQVKPSSFNVDKASEVAVLIDEYDPYQDEAFKAQLLEVAGLYAETIKYPIGSQPITNPDDVREQEPFEEAEVDLPFPESDDDSEPIRVSAATDTYQYFEGDQIKIRVSISRVPEDQFAKVSGVLSGSQGDLPVELDFIEADNSRTVFLASFDTRIAPKTLMSREMLAKLNITLGSRELFTTVGFRYAVASAEAIGVGSSFVDGANLVVPLQLNVYQSGYYFLNGVLEDQKTGKPLIQLQSEARLTQGNAVIRLNAHVGALRYQGSEGPYVLRSIKAYRGSEVGEAYDSPASSARNKFYVQGFPFNEFEDTEHVDEQGQESVDFLQDAGALNGNGETL